MQAAAFSGVTKTSTESAAKAFGSAGAAYDKAAKRLASLVDEPDAFADVDGLFESGAPRNGACVSALLVSWIAPSNGDTHTS